MKFDPKSAVVPEVKTFTYYLGNGVRLVKKGFGDEIEVARQNKILMAPIMGVQPGDDHSRRWNPESKTWEHMYFDWEPV